jgi:plastocyanin
MRSQFLIALLFLAVGTASAKEQMMMDHGGGHLMDMGGGMVMGQNTDRIPDGCSGIAATKEITVHGGHKYAKKFPGRMYAFDVQEYQFEPCTKLTVTFVNDDNVRHQWMMHGLPKYLYPKGMFHLEVTGPGKITGTLILPPGEKTYLIHCDLAQHMEKGMKGQLKTGNGTGDLPSIPGVTPFVIQDDYSAVVKVSTAAADTGTTSVNVKKVQENETLFSGLMVIGLAVGLVLAPFLARKFKGMSAGEITAYLVDLVKQIISSIVKMISWLIGLVMSKKKGAA